MDACPYAVAVVCMLCSGVECVRPAGVTARVWARMRSDCGRVADRTVGLCALSAVVCRQCCPPVEDVGMSGRSCPTGCPHAMWACGGESDGMDGSRGGTRTGSCVQSAL